jgi:poly-gamma-glutamate synthesis protein (capsule biosynthesis protein)
VTDDLRADDGQGAAGEGSIRLFLCGDVMTGRGIDQVLPHPCNPHLFEPWARSALRYVELAESASGPIGRGLDFAYPWGDALEVLQAWRPDARIVNLETAVTTSEDWQTGKGIHYRMNPENLPCLTRAGIDCCVLANNHVLDWGPAGLEQTLSSLHAAGLRTAGAGRNAQEAVAPAVIELDHQARLLLFAYGTPGSGVAADWAATGRRSGVNFLAELSARTGQRVAATIAPYRQPGDLVVVSVHWGGNWGFAIAPEEQAFAHAVIDAGGADIVYGHSSHHVKGVEVHGGKLILYGCGDLINDYEGIGGYGAFRSELSLMYLPEIERATGRLRRLSMVPMRIRRFRLERAPEEGVAWLHETLNREGRVLGTQVTQQADAIVLDR